MKLTKKAQIPLPRELIVVVAVGLVLVLVPIINKAIVAGTTGNIDSLVDLLTPLIIFAVFFEFIRRLFR